MLTLGEPTTSRALASVEAQTLPAAELALVEGVTPFHRALNEAAARVTAPFFVQVDADMVLNPGCFEMLRSAMAADVAIAVGALHDPIMGPVAGVKMYRREVFAEGGLRDRAAPEIDFYTRLAESGWRTACVVERPTLGAHLPEYDAEYVFGTYYMLGARYSHRADARGLEWRQGRLRRSAHPMAPAARLALGHGTFARISRDVPKPRPGPADARFLQELVNGPEAQVAEAELQGLLRIPSQRLSEGFRDYGASLRADGPARLRGGLRTLGEIDHPSSLLGEVALAHGALAA